MARSPSIRIKVDTQGLPELRAAIAQLRRQTTDLTPLMEAIGRQLSQRMRDSIAAGKTASGRRAPRPRDGQALVDTGELMRSITYSATRRKVEIGSPLDYSYYVNWGSIHNRPGLFLGTAKRQLAAKDKRTIGDAFRAHLLAFQSEAAAADDAGSVIRGAVSRMFKK